MFSPDGKWVAYFTVQLGGPGTLQQAYNVRRIAVTGGAAVTLGTIGGPPLGASWRNGSIIVGRGAAGIEAIPEDGGAPRTLVTVDEKTERAVQPQLLADGRHLVFTITTPLMVGRETATGEGQIVAQPIDGGSRKVLVNLGTNPRVLPTGHLVYVHDHTLFAVPFDERGLKVNGTPVPIIESIEQTGASAAAQFSVSDSGVLAYLPVGFASTARNLLWVDRNGREQVIATAPGAYQQPRLSPDGKRVAVSVNANISVWTLASGNMMRLTNESEPQYNPAWMPDSRRIVYDSNDGNGTRILRRSADGIGGVELIVPVQAGFPEIVTADGKLLVYHSSDRVAMLLPLDPAGAPRPLFKDIASQVSDAEISPDGRWIAYESNESGRYEVNVRSYPAVDSGRWQVSSDGGMHPLWSRDGGELFFIAADGMMMSARIEPGLTFSHARPIPLFPASQYPVQRRAQLRRLPRWKRFLMVKNALSATTLPTMVIVTRWFDELRAKMATTN